jgi:WXG100 family type VII secretion target
MEIKANYATIDQAGSDISDGARQIQETLDAMDAELQQLQQNWDGQAQQAYLQAKAKWSEGMNDMRQVLVAIGSHVSDASGSYRATDSSAAQAFGG